MASKPLTVGESLLKEFVKLRQLLEKRTSIEDVSEFRSIVKMALMSQIRETKFTLAIGVALPVAAANPRRWLIGFSASTNGTFQFSTQQNGDPDQGLRVASNEDQFLTIDKHLALPMAAWFGVLNAGPQTDCTVWECIMPNNVI